MTRRLRTALPLALLALAVIAAAWVGGAAPDGPPLDPRSAGPSGTRAVVDLVEGLGGDVRLAAQPGADDTTTLLLTDTLDEHRRDELEAWVTAGGLLVVSDPLSPLTPDVQATVGEAGGFTVERLAPDCDVAALGGIDEVAPPAQAAVFTVPAGAQGCFPAADGAWLVVEPRGDGAVVSLGGPDVLTNARLRDADHAPLVVALLAGDPAQASVAVIQPPRPGEGDAGLVDLVPDAVRLALIQLGVAFLLVVLWRARRLARPVAEAQPVELPASELVIARGNLLADARAADRAGQALRDDTRRRLAERCGLPPSTPPDRLAEVLVARYGVAREDVDRVFGGSLPAGDDELIDLAQAAERLRRSVLTPAAGGTS